MPALLVDYENVSGSNGLKGQMLYARKIRKYLIWFSQERVRERKLYIQEHYMNLDARMERKYIK